MPSAYARVTCSPGLPLIETEREPPWDCTSVNLDGKSVGRWVDMMGVRAGVDMMGVRAGGRGVALLGWRDGGA